MNSLAPNTRRLTRNFTIAFATAFILAGTSFGFTTNDGEICYDPMFGPRVTYKNIFESSQTDNFETNEAGESIGQYGTPTLNGDTMVFNIPQFSASAITNRRDADLTDGRLAMEISAMPGYYIEQIELFEFGSIGLGSNGIGNDVYVDVDAPMFLTVHEILLDDGTPGGLPHTLAESQTVAALISLDPVQQTAGRWSFADDPNIEIWEGEITMDVKTLLTQKLEDENVTLPGDLPIRGFTRGQYTMNNRLEAVAGDGTAFIDKKGVRINPFPIAVPEPATIALLLPLLGLGVFARRQFS